MDSNLLKNTTKIIIMIIVRFVKKSVDLIKIANHSTKIGRNVVDKLAGKLHSN